MARMSLDADKLPCISQELRDVGTTLGFQEEFMMEAIREEALRGDSEK